jgi:hypothetical protein
MRRIALVALFAMFSPMVFAQSPGSSWCYYGLPAGPGIRPLVPGEFAGVPPRLLKPKCEAAMLVYDPPTPTYFASPPPRTLILGWFTAKSPSPRPGPTVSVR